MRLKICTKCQVVKPVTSFAKASAKKDGFNYWCRACYSEYAKRHRAADPTRVRAEHAAATAKWRINHPERYRESAAKSSAKYKAKYPEKEVARRAVREAVRLGYMSSPGVCERCGGEGKLDGHHADYSKHLDVEWLCRPWHAAEHTD